MQHTKTLFDPGRSWRSVLSALIAACLGAQVLASTGVFHRYPSVKRAHGWPFVDYALFHDAHQRGETIATWVVLARAQSGLTYRLDVLQDSGVPNMHARDLVLALMAEDERALSNWCTDYELAMQVELLELDCREITYRLEKSGFVDHRESRRVLLRLAQRNQ